MVDKSQRFEYFEYPKAWAEAYRDARGSLRYFPQYALMEMLRQVYGIQSLTWLHLASVDKESRRRLAAGQPWLPASPNPCRGKPYRTQKRAETWATMRKQMGSGFDVLQRAIVCAGFKSYLGEPDLFCYRNGQWFFAEAKQPGEAFRP